MRDLAALNPVKCGSADDCTLFPQYQGPPAGYKDLPYDVVLERTIAAATFLPSQSVRIDNSDAPWYLLGFTYFANSDRILIAVYDWNNQQMQVNNPAMGTPALNGMFRQLFLNLPSTVLACPSYPERVWPRNSEFVTDLQSRETVDATDVMIYAWGFKRYAMEEAPCY